MINLIKFVLTICVYALILYSTEFLPREVGIFILYSQGGILLILGLLFSNNTYRILLWLFAPVIVYTVLFSYAIYRPSGDGMEILYLVLILGVWVEVFVFFLISRIIINLFGSKSAFPLK